MKRFFKVLGIIFLVIFGLIGTLIAAGWFMQDRIINIAINKVGETVGAPLGMEDVSLSLISDFPMARLQFDGLWIASPDSDSSSNSLDTLARFDRIYVSLESKPLLDNIINIREVEIENGFVKYCVSETGATSYDFLLVSDTTVVEPVDTTASAPLDLTLDKLSLSNIRCIYQDDQQKAKATLNLSSINASAKMDSVTMMADVQGVADVTGVAFDGTNVHLLNKVDMSFDALYNSDSVTIRSAKINADGTKLDASGLLLLGDQMETDMTLSMLVPNLSRVVKLAPDGTLQEFKLSEVAGSLAVTAKVDGVVGGEELPHYDANVSLKDGRVKYDTLEAVKNIVLTAAATNGRSNNNATTAVTLNEFALDFMGNHLAIEGFVKNLDKLQYDLTTRLNLNLKKLRPLIPDTLIQRPRGRLNATIHTQGTMPDSIDDAFIEELARTIRLNASFQNIGLDMDDELSLRSLTGKLTYVNKRLSIEDLGLYLPDYKLKLEDNALSAKMKGKVLQPSTMKLSLSKFRLGTAKNYVFGSASVNNLDHPTFNLNLSSEFDLIEIKTFLPDTLVNDMQGRISLKVESNGKLDLDKIEEQAPDIFYDNTFVDLTVADLALDMPDTIMNVRDVSGRVRIDKDRIDVNNFKGHYSGLDFSVDRTTIKSLFSTIMKGEPGKLEVEGVYRLGYLDYEKLMAMTSGGAADSTAVEETAEVESEETQAEPLHYEVKGKFYVDSVKYEKAMIRDISGLFNAKDSSFVVEETGEQMNEMVVVLDKLKYKAFEGSGMSSMKVEITPDEMYVKMKNEADHINMRQVFKDMDSFGQGELISYENLNGFVSSEGLYLQLRFIGDSLIYPDMRMSGDFSYIDGAIYNYEPVLAMEALPGMKNLDSLRFKPINNRELYIFKNDLVIPKIFVVTNRFDAEFSAMQSLGEDFKYLVSVSATQFIGGKSKKRKAKQAALGDKAADERGDQKFMHVITSVKDGKFKNDLLVTEKERNEMGRKIRVRKTSNKIQFHPELFHFETGVDD